MSCEPPNSGPPIPFTRLDSNQRLESLKSPNAKCQMPLNIIFSFNQFLFPKNFFDIYQEKPQWSHKKSNEFVLVAKSCQWSSCTPTLLDVQALRNVASGLRWGPQVYWLPIGVIGSIGEMQILERKVMHWEEDMSWKDCWFESRCQRRIVPGQLCCHAVLISCKFEFYHVLIV